MDDWILPSGRWSSRKVPPEIRFWRHVNKAGPVPSHRPELGQCWEWTGARNERGYGKFGANWRRPEYAHRFSWTLTYGSHGESQVLHKCDNRHCVNPGHLFLGTHQDNMDDMAAKGRSRNRPMPGATNPNAKLSDADVTEIRRLYDDEDLTQNAIAIRMGISRSMVGSILRGRNWVDGKSNARGPLYRSGERAGMAKLTEDAVRQIRSANEPLAHTARRFSVSPSLVGLIKRRLIWKHVA